MAAECASCGFANDAGDRFCGGCGQSLEVAEPAAAQAPAQGVAGAPRERRQVTVLFADISSFTRMSKVLDPEETYAVLQSFFSAADAVIERFGGTIDKHIGDAVMGLFGAPIAHDDDPLRAVRAAIELHAEVEALGAKSAHPFRVHIGIAAGEVVAGGVGSEGRNDYTVIGASVNLAARLQEHAAGRETLISDTVFQSVADLVRGEPVEIAEGTTQMQKAWRVLGLKDGIADEALLPIVGRDSELRHFEALTGAAMTHGRGEAVLIRGDAGIGKTRLVQEYCRRAIALGFDHHGAQILDFGASAGQDAIRVLVRGLLGLAGAAAQADRKRALVDAVSAGNVRSELEIFLHDLLDLPTSAEMGARYEAMDNATRTDGKIAAIVHLIAARAASSPLLITVEDLHWAKPVTLNFLAHILDGISGHPVVLVMTTRVEGDPMTTVWRGGLRGVPLFTINLNPLGQAAAKEFATQFIGQPTKFVADCIARADGNPLFLQQLLKSADEHGGQNLPATIQSLVLSRMDRLGPREKEALQAASIAGQRVDARLLTYLLGVARFDFKPLFDSQLMRAEGEDVLFTHSLIRDGVYSSLLKTSARELHKRAATYYRELDPILRAEHLDKAQDPQAAEAYLEASKLALADHHTVQARLLVERGLELNGATPVGYQLQCLHGDILHSLNQADASVSAYQVALELAGSDEAKCAPIIGMVRGMRDGHQLDEALSLLTTAEDIATRLSLPRFLSQIHAQRGNLYFPRGRVDACHAEQMLSLKHAKAAKSPRLEAQALSGLGDAEYVRGHMATAHAHFDDCVALCSQHQLLRIEAPNLALRGLTNFYCGLPQSCLDDCNTAIEMAKGARHLRAELVARTALAPALLEMQDFDGAAAQTARAAEIIDDLGARRFLPECRAVEAKIAYANGAKPEARALAAEAVQISLESDAGRSFTGPWALGTLALVSDDAAARKDALSEGLQQLSGGCVSHNHLWFHRDAIEASLRAQDWDGAVRFAQELESYTQQEPLAWSAHYAEIARIVADGHRDGWTEDRLRQAADHCAVLAAARLDLAAALLAGLTPEP